MFLCSITAKNCTLKLGKFSAKSHSSRGCKVFWKIIGCTNDTILRYWHFRQHDCFDISHDLRKASSLGQKVATLPKLSVSCRPGGAVSMFSGYVSVLSLPNHFPSLAALRRLLKSLCIICLASWMFGSKGIAEKTPNSVMLRNLQSLSPHLAQSRI